MAESAIDPASVTNDELTTSVCGPEHREEQARLFNACFKKTLAADALVWRYDTNPHGGSVSILTRPPGGEGISGYACNPRRALANGDESTLGTIGQTGDVMTHPSWRKRGIFSDLDRACMVETARLGWPFVFGLPNRRSAHIFLKLGWDQVGTVRPWSFYFAAGAREREIRSREGRVAGLRLPLDVRRCRAGLRRLDADGAGFEARPLERFPEEVVELSREVEAGFPLMVRRDADYLNWRFVDTSTRLHRVLGVHGEDGALAGYAAVQLPFQGSSVGYFVDLLAPDPAARARALHAGLERLREGGARVVQATAIDDGWWSGVLQRSGFLPPKPDNHLIVIRHLHRPDHPLAAASANASSWYLTDGDRDDETMG